jgi:2-dehydro-3-deoxyglucarate aldolase
MDRLKKIVEIRKKLLSKKVTLGSWMQLPNASVAEIIGHSGYDWVAVDLEHGSISVHQLPDIYRALELGNTLPLARVSEANPKDCKQALDAGAGGVIVPMISSAEQLQNISDAIRWPPAGNRGVSFNRANLYGEHFNSYLDEAQNPLLVAMIENINALENLEDILSVQGLDSILIGPYDLSASMGLTGQFNNPKFLDAVEYIKLKSGKLNVACGIHIVSPSVAELKERIIDGYQFIAYSIDSVFLNHYSKNPLL